MRWCKVVRCVVWGNAPLVPGRSERHQAEGIGEAAAPEAAGGETLTWISVAPAPASMHTYRVFFLTGHMNIFRVWEIAINLMDFELVT